jgi:hypothetical protein
VHFTFESHNLRKNIGMDTHVCRNESSVCASSSAWRCCCRYYLDVCMRGRATKRPPIEGSAPCADGARPFSAQGQLPSRHAARWRSRSLKTSSMRPVAQPCRAPRPALAAFCVLRLSMSHCDVQVVFFAAGPCSGEGAARAHGCTQRLNTLEASLPNV